MLYFLYETKTDSDIILDNVVFKLIIYYWYCAQKQSRIKNHVPTYADSTFMKQYTYYQTL